MASTLTNQDVINTFFAVAEDLDNEGWELVKKAGWTWLAENRNAPFDQGLLTMRPGSLADNEWQVIATHVAQKVEKTQAPLATQPLAASGVAGSPLVVTSLPIRPRVPATRLSSGPQSDSAPAPSLPEPIAPPEPVTPVAPVTAQPEPQPAAVPTSAGDDPGRDLTHQEVINIFYKVANRLGMDGWELVEKAGWEWLGQGRHELIDPALVKTQPAGLSAEEWELISMGLAYTQKQPAPVSSTPQPQPKDGKWPEWWPWQHSLVGLHGRGDGLNRERDFEQFRVGRIESVKYMSRAGEQADQHVQVARDLAAGGPVAIVLRPMYNFPTNFAISPDQFANDIMDHMRAFGRHTDILWLVEIHNEPNVFIEGFGGTWKNGKQFAEWWRRVRDKLLPTMPATAKWGYPGLSPGGRSTFRGMGEREFFLESEAAWREADWVACHCYWQTEAQMTHPDAGYSWQWIKDTSGKPVAITEFSNTHPGVDKKDKAQQYVNYYRKLRNVPGMLGMYSFLVSTSGDHFEHEKWGNEIAPIVGARDF